MEKMEIFGLVNEAREAKKQGDVFNIDILITRLVRGSLSPQELTALDTLHANGGTCNTKMVAFALGVPLNHAGNVLTNLERYGLVTRERQKRDMVWTVIDSGSFRLAEMTERTVDA